MEGPLRHLVLVLGDQLDHESAAFEGFDAGDDAVWMAENRREATHVWCHQLRLAYFFSCMRHFRDELRERGRTVRYHALTPRERDDRGESFAEILQDDVRALRPSKLVLAEPGDHRVLEMLRGAAAELGVELEARPDRSFVIGRDEYERWASGRKSLVLEHFYRHLRRQHGVLLTDAGEPVGGEWSFDRDNRKSFGKAGPGEIAPPARFDPDATTLDVIIMVRQRFADHPGRLDVDGGNFDLPVTRADALRSLRHFLDRHLVGFGTYEDAMWSGDPFLHHSRLSAPLNVKLITPWECIEGAVEAYERGAAPINDVEGFVRQVLGWRELVRGIYWQRMPGYARLNALGAEGEVPAFYWTADTDMNCLRHCLRSVVDHAWAHHIPRLMVMGLYAQLLGVHPLRFHEWHMAMYVDAVDWVSLPNALGMSQYGDGGVVGTKPYCATGNYINRMSDFCRGCRYDPRQSHGEDACPFTTLYWDFLDRHQERLASNNRMRLQMNNLERKQREQPEEMQAIRERAQALRAADGVP